MIFKRIFHCLVFIAAVFFPASCSSVDYTVPLSGKYIEAGIVHKGFLVIGPVSASSQEIHTCGPFGFVKKVEGSKITHSDLVIEAAKLEADDIINIRIDINTDGKTRFIDWIRGWKRTFTYTGHAIAVKYVDEDVIDDVINVIEVINVVEVVDVVIEVDVDDDMVDVDDVVIEDVDVVDDYDDI